VLHSCDFTTDETDTTDTTDTTDETDKTDKTDETDKTISSDCTDLVLAEDDPVEVEIVDPEDEAFDAFWSAYPRKEGKKTARTSWNNIPKRDRPLATGVAQVMRQLVDAGAQELRFVPFPATFLNQHRYEDWREGIPAGWRPPGEERATRLESVIAAAVADVESRTVAP